MTTSTPAVGTSARLAPRATARAVDAALLAIVGAGAGAVTGFGYGWLAAELVLVLAYFVGLDALRGATLGKSLVGLRVTGLDGDCPPTIVEAAKREAFVVLGAVPFVGPLLAAVAWSAIAWTIRRGDAIHDRFAGTRVVATG